VPGAAKQTRHSFETTMEDSIDRADVPQVEYRAWLVPHPATWKNYTCCPWATTIIAECVETGNLMCCPVTCKRWGCPFCARNKIRKLAYLTNGAKPNRWIRLGVDPAQHESPRQAWEKTSPMLPEACKILRKECGECEYLRVTELHESGFPHYHALLRSAYIPQRLLSDVWGRLAGAPVVWIAKIDSTFSSFRYLVKYLTKLHKIEWTDRHVSYSRNFFNPADRERMAFPERAIEERSEEHPWLWLSRRFPTSNIPVDSRGNYHLPEPFFGTPYQLTREDVGLPPLPSKHGSNDEPPLTSKSKYRQTEMVDRSDDEDYPTASF